MNAPCSSRGERLAAPPDTPPARLPRAGAAAATSHTRGRGCGTTRSEPPRARPAGPEVPRRQRGAAFLPARLLPRPGNMVAEAALGELWAGARSAPPCWGRPLLLIPPPPASRPAALLCPARRRWGRRARRAVSECVAHVGVPVRPGASGKMLLSLVLHTYSMRYFLPAAVMMGTAPTYVLAWGAWRLLSAVLPARFYREVDDRLYTIYQSMVLFFFENYAGVQVSRWRGAGLPHGGRWGAAGGSAEPAPFPGRPRASPAPGAAPAVGRKRAAAVCRCGLRPFPAHTALWG